MAGGGLRVPGAPGNSLQLAGSSLPSTQSLSRSQTQTRGMQRLVMEHWNWLGAQVTSAVGSRQNESLPFLPPTTVQDHCPFFQALPVPASCQQFLGRKEEFISNFGAFCLLCLYGTSIFLPSMTIIACKPKGCQFDSQSGHIPGLQARSLWGACERQPHIEVSLPPFPSLLK